MNSTLPSSNLTVLVEATNITFDALKITNSSIEFYNLNYTKATGDKMFYASCNITGSNISEDFEDTNCYAVATGGGSSSTTTSGTVNLYQLNTYIYQFKNRMISLKTLDAIIYRWKHGI